MVSIIQDEDVLGVTQLRRDALTIVKSGYEAIDTRVVLSKYVTFSGSTLTVAGHTYSLRKNQKVWVVGAGKCAIAGASALEGILGNRIEGGVIIDVADTGNYLPLKKIEYFLGTHPRPSEGNTKASQCLVDVLELLTEDDLVIVLVSGGGSTLLCLPEAPLTCDMEASVFTKLTEAGANIQEMNTVRKHLSRVRGGRLAYSAYPAQVIGLIFSDVPGNDLSFISSGPTVQDSTTVKDAQDVVEKYHVSTLEGVPFLETPKDEKYFAHVQNELLVTNVRALDAMAKTARTFGYTPRIVTDSFHGEARDIASEVVDSLAEAAPATVLLYGGESTVTLGNHAGKGGRNQELALAALAHISSNEIIIPFSSDGRDNTDSAGAICDSITREHAEALSLDINEYLTKHSSYDFFAKTKDSLVTGYTGANVSDIIIALKSA